MGRSRGAKERNRIPIDSREHVLRHVPRCPLEPHPAQEERGTLIAER